MQSSTMIDKKEMPTSPVLATADYPTGRIPTNWPLVTLNWPTLLLLRTGRSQDPMNTKA